MQRRALLALAGATIASACTSQGGLPALESSFAYAGASPRDALDAVNRARARNGRAPMRIDGKAQRAAARHARSMARAAKMAHILPGEPGFTKRLARDGIRTLAAENVAWGQRDVAGAMTAWMNSSGHRRNILDKRFNGVGVASAPAADGRLYWAMILVP